MRRPYTQDSDHCRLSRSWLVNSDSLLAEVTQPNRARHLRPSSVWLLPSPPLIDRHRRRAAQSPMRPTLAVVLSGVCRQLPQMVRVPDKRDSRQPFVLERPNQPFRHDGGTVPAHRAEAVLDVPVCRQLGECLAGEDTLSITDQVLGGPVAQKGIL